MRIVFLDIDGVLNSNRYWKQNPGLKKKISLRIQSNWHLAIDPYAVEILNSIVSASAARVVISSSWRNFVELTQIQSFLEQKGFVGNVIDRTPRIETAGTVRGHEIQAWLDNRPDVKRFVILDHDSDMDVLSDHLVQTSYEHGLRVEHIRRALDVLECACLELR